MNPTKGYYSLIQFCPDASRLEAVNLGVILFCPALDFLASRTSRSTRRAEKLVGRGELAREALKLARTSIEHGLRIGRDSFKVIAYIQRFVEPRAPLNQRILVDYTGRAPQGTQPMSTPDFKPLMD